MAWRSTEARAGDARGAAARQKYGSVTKGEAMEVGEHGGEKVDVPPARVVRWDRILALQEAIADGSYRVAADVLAECLMRPARSQNRSAVMTMYSA